MGLHPIIFELLINFQADDGSLLFERPHGFLAYNEVFLPIHVPNVNEITPEQKKRFTAWRFALSNMHKVLGATKAGVFVSKRSWKKYLDMPYYPLAITNKLVGFDEFMANYGDDMDSPAARAALLDKTSWFSSWKSLIPVDDGVPFPDTLAYAWLKFNLLGDCTTMLHNQKLFMMLVNNASRYFMDVPLDKDSLFRSEDNCLELAVNFDYGDDEVNFKSFFTFWLHLSKESDASFFDDALKFKEMLACGVFNTPSYCIEVHPSKYGVYPIVELFGYSFDNANEKDICPCSKKFDLNKADVRDRFLKSFMATFFVDSGEDDLDPDGSCLPA